MNSIKEVIEDLKQGQFVILLDDENRENEADLIIAAEHVDDEKLNFMVRKTSGFICLPMAGEYLDRLNIPMMTNDNHNRFSTPFTMSIEAATGITTGVSIVDRIHTIKTVIADDAQASDIVMPGHIMPLRAQDNGVLVRAGHTEGSVDLMRLAGCKPAAIICELMDDDGKMLRGEKLFQFAGEHGIKMTSVQQLREYRLAHEMIVQKTAETNLPIKGLGDFIMQTYIDELSAAEYIVLMKLPLVKDGTLVRIHSQCLTGDLFSSQRCDCGEQLQLSLATISKHGGLLIYLPQEGRGIGLTNKIKSYALQEQGCDSVEANHRLGFEDDLRDYYPAAQILRQLHVDNIRLLTNNPDKCHQLEKYGINIRQREPLLIEPCTHNFSYLLTKQNKLQHILNMEA